MSPTRREASGEELQLVPRVLTCPRREGCIRPTVVLREDFLRDQGLSVAKGVP
jgi:hypothetical protein